jgi:hypothetical protein
MVVGCSVGAAVGLAPWLGTFRVPLFTPLLDILPIEIQEFAIPLASFACALVAAVVQFYSDTVDSRARLRRPFLRTLALAAALLLAFVALHVLGVATVRVAGEQRNISMIVGVTGARTATCPCSSPSNTVCIGRELPKEPGITELCWSSGDIRVTKLLLVVLYIGLFATFGWLIGYLVRIRQRVPVARARARV